jgi:hypothetical protein
MSYQEQELYFAKIKAIAKGVHGPLLAELIYILDNPAPNCPNGLNDGPLGALRQIIHHVYLDFKDSLEQGLACPYTRTCVSARGQDCSLPGAGKAKILPFKCRSG